MKKCVKFKHTILFLFTPMHVHFIYFIFDVLNYKTPNCINIYGHKLTNAIIRVRKLLHLHVFFLFVIHFARLQIHTVTRQENKKKVFGVHWFFYSNRFHCLKLKKKSYTAILKYLYFFIDSKIRIFRFKKDTLLAFYFTSLIYMYMLYVYVLSEILFFCSRLSSFKSKVYSYKF